MLSQATHYSPKFISITSPDIPVHGAIPVGQSRISSSGGLVPLLAGIVFMSTAGNVGDISEYLPKQQANTSNKYGYFQFKVAQNKVAELKSELKFNNSDLARIVGVTRQTVHDWLNDHQISEVNKLKLDTLRRIAFHLQSHGVDVNARTFLRAFGSDQLSLASIIQAGVNPDELSDVIIKTAQLESKSRSRLNQALSSRDTSSKDLKELLTSSLLES